MIDTLFFSCTILSTIALFLLGFSILVWKPSTKVLDFGKHGQPATATVLQKFTSCCEPDRSGNESDQHHYVAYEYQTPGGKTVRQKELLSETDWNQVMVGERITILYLPQSPESSRYKLTDASFVLRSSNTVRRAAYVAGGLTIGCYILWYVLAVTSAATEVNIPRDRPSQQVEADRKVPKRI